MRAAAGSGKIPPGSAAERKAVCRHNYQTLVGFSHRNATPFVTEFRLAFCLPTAKIIKLYGQ
jgi:hypothetical protein